MIIGNFTFDKKSGVYIGDVTTLSFHRTSMMFRPLEKSSDKEPDYRIVAQGAFGYVEFGAAWKRTSERGQRRGAPQRRRRCRRRIRLRRFPACNGRTNGCAWSAIF